MSTRIMPGKHGGKEVVEALVRAYRWSWEPFSRHIRAVTPEEVRDWLGRGESGVILLGRHIVGAIWAWSRDPLGHVWLFYDTRIPHPYRTGLVAQSLEWAALKLARRNVTVVDVRAGLYGSRLHSDLRGILGSTAVELRWGTLMVGSLEGLPIPEKPRPPAWLDRLRLADCRSLDPDRIASLLNAAFSRYQWWEPVSSQYIAWRLARPTTTCIALVSGKEEPLALFDANISANLHGEPLVEPLHLAVHPRLQGRGIGSWLIARATQLLKDKLGKALIVVDSAPGLEQFYAKYGLTIKTWWTTLRLPLNLLENTQ